MQQRIQAGWQWFQHRSRNMKVGLVCGALIVTCVACSGITAAIGSGAPVTSTVGSVNKPTATLGPTSTSGPTATPMPTAAPIPTATPQVVQYPPISANDLQGLAAQGDSSAIHESHRENVGLTGACPEIRVEAIVDPSVTGEQLAKDMLAHYYSSGLEDPCGSLLLVYHSQSEIDEGDPYTAGRINLDVTDSSGQGNVDPNGTNLTYTVTLDVGDALSNSQESMVTYTR